VRERSGCDLHADTEVAETRSPGLDELVIIREVLDPKGLRHKEVP